MPDPISDNRRRAAAWRSIAAALSVPVVPGLANNASYLELQCVERLASLLHSPGGKRLVADLADGATDAPAAEPAPAVHVMGEYIAPDTEPAPDYAEQT